MDGCIRTTAPARYGPTMFQPRLAPVARRCSRPGARAGCFIAPLAPRRWLTQAQWVVRRVLGHGRVCLVYCLASRFSGLRPPQACRSGWTEGFVRCLLGGHVRLRMGYSSHSYRLDSIFLRGWL